MQGQRHAFSFELAFDLALLRQQVFHFLAAALQLSSHSGNAQFERLQVIVPRIAVEEGTAVPVVVRVGPDAAAPVQLIVGGLPMVTAVKPPTGSAAGRVELQGRGFDPTGGTRVSFDGRPALVLSATPDTLEVMVPAIAGSGPGS